MINSILHSTSHKGVSALDCTQPHSLSDIKSAIAKFKIEFGRVERWQFTHYKERGFLSWVARLILLIRPSSSKKFEAIEKLEIKLKLIQEKLSPAITPSVAKPIVDYPLSAKAQAEQAIILSKLKKRPCFINHIQLSDELKNSRSFILAAIEMNPSALQLVNPDCKADKEIMLAAVKKKGVNLYLASHELKNDKEVVLAAIGEDSDALKWAARKLRADKEVVLLAVMKNGKNIQYASSELKADKELLLVAVKKDGEALYWTTDALKADKEVVLPAVTKSGGILQYASPELQADKEVVMAAVTQRGWALQFASPELRADIEVVMAAVKQDGLALPFASPELGIHKELIMTAVTKSGPLLKLASSELRADKEVVMAAVKQQSVSLKYASNVNNALAQYKAEFSRLQRWQFAHYKGSGFLSWIAKFILLIIPSSRKRFDKVKLLESQVKYVQKSMHLELEPTVATATPVGSNSAACNPKTTNSKAANTNSSALQYASLELKADIEVVAAAVTNDGLALGYACDELKANKKIVLAAVMQNGAALLYASSGLQKDEGLISLAQSKMNFV